MLKLPVWYFLYDYLIDRAYIGVEGAEYITLSGHIFKVYRTIQAAVI